MFVRQDTLKRLSENLSLPYTGTEQDWELEMADASRIDEFIEYYKNNLLSKDEKYALISLIIASYDDVLSLGKLRIDHNWTMIKTLLEKDRILFADLISYWKLEDETDDDNLFAITPLIRTIK